MHAHAQEKRRGKKFCEKIDRSPGPDFLPIGLKTLCIKNGDFQLPNST